MLKKPMQKIKISSFYTGKYEVTFDEWSACVLVGGCKHEPKDRGWGRGDRPVINVSWNDTQEFVRWLSKKTGQKYRLLSEAEWEYAARGNTGQRRKYWWGNEIKKNGIVMANCYGCGSQWDNKRTAPVGSFDANPFGLHDMHGNVWEWVEDCYRDSYSGQARDGSAWKKSNCKTVVLRGGSWYNDPVNLRSANRYRFIPDIRDIVNGFRVGRSVFSPSTR